MVAPPTTVPMATIKRLFRPCSAHAAAGVEECTLVADSLSSTLLFHHGSGDRRQESGSVGAHQHTSSQHPGLGCWSHSFPGSVSGVVWSKHHVLTVSSWGFVLDTR